VIIESLPFAHFRGFSRIFINLWRQHLHVGSRRAYPLPQSRFNDAILELFWLYKFPHTSLYYFYYEIFLGLTYLKN